MKTNSKKGKLQRVISNPDLFENQDRIEKLKRHNNSLIKLNKYINWSFFGKEIDRQLPMVDYSKGGRPPISRELLFKILVLQHMFNLSDDGIEYQSLDRNSFMEFLGLKTFRDIPDSKTIWLVRDQLNKLGILDDLFVKFNTQLMVGGIILNKGTITDATIIETPKQRNTKEENALIKEEKGEDLWEDNPNKKQQKDIDARWLKKDGQSYFGYKDHVVVDVESKLILDFEVTPANEHDSQLMPEFINRNPEVEVMYGDSAYISQEISEKLAMNNIENKIHEKGKRNKVLTKAQFNSNKRKSKIRARVEHVFGMIAKGMGGLMFQVRSLKRVTAKITLMNLTYNIKRLIYLIDSNGGAMLSFK
ncbi:MAG: IS5 family transposase [Saprospiraceae bacterium]|nr:IS5 family transposase [Saprospiraceae bacterium]